MSECPPQQSPLDEGVDAGQRPLGKAEESIGWRPAGANPGSAEQERLMTHPDEAGANIVGK